MRGAVAGRRCGASAAPAERRETAASEESDGETEPYLVGREEEAPPRGAGAASRGAGAAPAEEAAGALRGWRAAAASPMPPSGPQRVPPMRLFRGPKSSKYIGVCATSRSKQYLKSQGQAPAARWAVNAWIEGRMLYVGTFADEETAARAYDVVVLFAYMRKQKEVVTLNFPKDEYKDTLRQLSGVRSSNVLLKVLRCNPEIVWGGRLPPTLPAPSYAYQAQQLPSRPGEAAGTAVPAAGVGLLQPLGALPPVTAAVPAAVPAAVSAALLPLSGMPATMLPLGQPTMNAQALIAQLFPPLHQPLYSELEHLAQQQRMQQMGAGGAPAQAFNFSTQSLGSPFGVAPQPSIGGLNRGVLEKPKAQKPAEGSGTTSCGEGAQILAAPDL